MYILIKTWPSQAVLLSDPSTPASSSALLPYWALLVAWLPSPFIVHVRWLLACLLDYLLQARLPLSHKFSTTVLSDNLTPVAFFWASLLESWAFGSWAPSLPHPPAPGPSSQGAATLIPFYHSLLFPIRGTCILNVSALSVSVATVPLLRPFPILFSSHTLEWGAANLQILARYHMCWVEPIV